MCVYNKLNEGTESKASDKPLNNDYLLTVQEFYAGNVLERLIVKHIVSNMSESDTFANIFNGTGVECRLKSRFDGLIP